MLPHNVHFTHLLSLTVWVTAVVNKARIVSLASGIQDLREMYNSHPSIRVQNKDSILVGRFEHSEYNLTFFLFQAV